MYQTSALHEIFFNIDKDDIKITDIKFLIFLDDTRHTEKTTTHHYIYTSIDILKNK